MGKVVEFRTSYEKKRSEKWEAFQKAVEADKQCHTLESGIAMLSAGGAYIEVLAEDEEFVKWMEDSSARWEKKFLEKYGQQIAAAPDMPVPRIQYFCRIMQELMPQIENGSMDENWGHAVSEFGEFYVCYMEDALSMWCDADPKITEMLDNMDSVLHMSHSMPENSITDAKNAIAYILAVRPDSNDVKSRILLGTTMLFHAYSGLTDLELERMKQAK